MSVDALEISITEESHQSVIVDAYRFDFSYNALIDSWFISLYKNDELVYGSIKIVPNVNLFDFLNIGELIVFHDRKVTRDELVRARVVYIPKAKDEI